jgi:hypothetical protein
MKKRLAAEDLLNSCPPVPDHGSAKLNNGAGAGIRHNKDVDFFPALLIALHSQLENALGEYRTESSATGTTL